MRAEIRDRIKQAIKKAEREPVPYFYFALQFDIDSDNEPGTTDSADPDAD